MNNAREVVITAITPNGSAPLPFVIPSVAEGSAVLLISSENSLASSADPLRSTLTCLRQVDGGMNNPRVDYGECKCHK